MHMRGLGLLSASERDRAWPWGFKTRSAVDMAVLTAGRAGAGAVGRVDVLDREEEAVVEREGADLKDREGAGAVGRMGGVMTSPMAW